MTMLHAVRDAGVVYLQLTDGEPLIDRLFCETYELAWRLGMMLHISTNGSRLHNPRILELLAACPPYRITVSAYGATEASYDALVRRPGAFRLFSRGMAAALEAGLPLRMNIVLTKTNAHEQDAMIAMAERWGLRYLVYSNLSPTIYGGGEVLPAQSAAHLKAGGCSGCVLSGTCTVCRPLAKLYQQAKAPLEYYCQHGRRRVS
jgi:MoaA/NifB/PqqE/SkfB family radical SAM enzyme